MLNDKLMLRLGTTFREALKSLDEGAQRILFIVDDAGVLLGTFTDGDARRALLDGRDLAGGIDSVYNRNPVKFRADEDYAAAAADAFRNLRITHIPLVDSRGALVDIVTPIEETTTKGGQRPIGPALNLPIVIMAGGKGTRMAPFTNVLPKPLVPIGDKTILELIMDEFARHGASEFHITINYKGEMIRAYLEGLQHGHRISYVREKDFYGTAGSVRLVGEIGPRFIVSNCDIIVKADFTKVVDFHRKAEAILTIVSSLQHHTIPYGVVDFEAGGRVSGIREKPEYSFPINTGVYVLEAACRNYIPPDTVFNMTDLIAALLRAGKSVYTYPLNESDYIDVGQWDAYRQVVRGLS